MPGVGNEFSRKEGLGTSSEWGKGWMFFDIDLHLNSEPEA